MTTIYVDTSSPTTPGSGTLAYPYRSLSIAEAALPATLGDAYEIVCMASSGVADASSSVFTGVTTSATNNLHVYSHVDHRPAGKWDTAKYRLDVGSARAISNGLANITFTSIAAKTREIGFYHDFYTQTATTKFIGCIAGGSWSGGTGFFLEVNGAECWNCIAYGCYQGFNGGGTLTKFYNCTSVANRQNGFYRAGGTPVCTNCYAGDNVVGQYTASLTLTTCGSSDTSGSTGLQNIAVSTSTGAKFTNVTAGSEDFHLQSGSALIDVGTSLSGTFTTDIDGETRSGTWDVGADEFVGGGSQDGNATDGSFTVAHAYNWTSTGSSSATQTVALQVAHAISFAASASSSRTVEVGVSVGHGVNFPVSASSSTTVVVPLHVGHGYNYEATASADNRITVTDVLTVAHAYNWGPTVSGGANASDSGLSVAHSVSFAASATATNVIEVAAEFSVGHSVNFASSVTTSTTVTAGLSVAHSVNFPASASNGEAPSTPPMSRTAVRLFLGI